MKKQLLFGFMLLSTMVFGQSGTSISYLDNVGPSTLSYDALVNGKHAYKNTTDVIYLQYSTARSRWEIFYNATLTAANVAYYSTKQTTSNPPNFTVGAWVDNKSVALGNSDGVTMSALSGTGTTSTVLPIELVSFDVQNTEGGKNHLTWRTESEKDNSHFDIERSTDGNTFHNIGQVRGNNKPSSYQYVDAAPFTMSYYRLKQVDFDGTETYSKVVSVEQKGKGKGLKVYPTLVSNGILSVDTEGGQLRAFSVSNLLGQQVLVGTTTQQIDVSRLSQGTYVLKVGSEVAKFVKQ
jgi:hypothetical protein